MATQVFDALVLQDVNQKLIPGLAVSWTPVGETCTWEFKLRPGVTFHNGAAFTAEDVRRHNGSCCRCPEQPF